jgi:hypothetical protein
MDDQSPRRPDFISDQLSQLRYSRLRSIAGLCIGSAVLLLLMVSIPAAVHFWPSQNLAKTIVYFPIEAASTPSKLLVRQWRTPYFVEGNARLCQEDDQESPCDVLISLDPKNPSRKNIPDILREIRSLPLAIFVGGHDILDLRRAGPAKIRTNEELAQARAALLQKSFQEAIKARPELDHAFLTLARAPEHTRNPSEQDRTVIVTLLQESISK